MSAPPSAEVAWSDDGRLRSTRYGDIYFAADGLAESRAVFLHGCGLPEAWADRGHFTVAELGFGTGLNVLALLDLWRRTRPPEGRLRIFSIEAHPLSGTDAARALASFPELADLAPPLLVRWPGAARGFERYDWPQLGATLDLATMEAAEALAAWSGPADAWFLDGFAPALNPQMWRDEVLDLVRDRSSPDARLATFTVAGAVRRALAARGFEVARAPGHGRKRERLEARLRGPAPVPAGRPAVAILGGGVAGASLARAFSQLGARCTVVDPTPEAAASRNPAALVSPRLDAGDNAPARLYAQAFARAVDLYGREAPEAVIARGGLRLASSPRDIQRFDALSRSELFRPGALTHLDAESASARLGAPSGAALWIPDALTLNPLAVLEAWLSTAAWAAEFDEAAEPPIVCVAAGAEARRWLPEGLLEPVRGQASWSTSTALPGSAASWGGYAVPLPHGGFLFGATHARGSDDRTATAQDERANLQGLASRLPGLADELQRGPVQSRASIRAATPDRLPLAGAVPGRPGWFVLGGLGGRGFTTAPLLAEHLASLALGVPSPLPRDLADAVDPMRFELRARRRVGRR